MLLSVGVAALLPYGVLIALSITLAYRSASEDSFRYEGARSEHLANLIASKFAFFSGQGRSLASSFSSFSAIPSASRRSAINAELRSVIEGQPDILAAWAQWERGAIGDSPAAYAGSLLSTSSGAFNATWYRRGHAIVQGSVDDSAYQGDFYLLPKARGRTTLVEPYPYSYTGRKEDAVLETSLCFPIFEGERFVGVLGFDFELASFFKEALAEVKKYQERYGMVVTGSGTVASHILSEHIGKAFTEGFSSEEQRGSFLALLAAGRSFTFDKFSPLIGEDSRYYFAPIRTDGVERPWYFAMVASKAGILAPARAVAYAMIGMGVLGAVVVSASISLASKNLAAPFAALAEGARRISSGDLSFRVPSEEPGGTSSEALALTSSFNAMADRLEEILSGLEAKVAERTASLEAANAELKAAQSGLEVAAKLALLGRLTAGISHDLNTPIGAIRSSVSLSLCSVEELVRGFLPIYATLPAADRALFHALFDGGLRKGWARPGREDRRRKAELARRLEAGGVEGAWFLADAIANLGAYDREAEVVDCVARGGWPIVAAAEKAAETCRSASIVLEAAERAARTVSALATYSRGQDFDVLEPVRPAEDLEAVLTLNSSRIGSSVVVARDYACRDPVMAYRDKLKEVWMNLIDNALQAMDYKGSLGLATSREGDWVVVSISDTGRGIPEGLRDKVFTPFFSTKPPGEGVGLGLDICRRIVERHGGAIGFESGPGGSVFSVRLRASGAPGAPPTPGEAGA